MFKIEQTLLPDDAKENVLAYQALCGAKLFVPNRPQFDNIRAVGTLPLRKDPHPVRIFLVTSGNGVGKTTTMWNIITNIVYGAPVNMFTHVKDVQTGEQFEGFFDWPMYKEWPKGWPKKIWYVSNRDTLNDIWEEAKNWLPSNSYNEKFWTDLKSGKTYIERVTFKRSPWILFFKTVDQDPKTFEGANVSLMIFDEPPLRKLFSAAVARTRSGGIILIPATPLMDAAWFVTDIIEKIPENDDTWHDQVPVWDNCIERCGEWDLGLYGIQKKGNLTEENIKFMIRTWPEEEIPARERGEFMHLSGVIYRTYSKYRKQVFIERPIKVNHPLNYVYRFVLDPHDRKPPAAMWLRKDRFGTVDVIREWPSIDDPEFDGRLFVDILDTGDFIIEDFVDIFMAIEKELEIPPSRIQDIIDPNFGLKRSSVTGRRIYEEYMLASKNHEKKKGYGRQYGFILDVDDALQEGHTAVRQLLMPNLDGDRNFFIHDRCINTDTGMRFYAYKKQPAKMEEQHGLTDMIAQKYKDYPDLVRYHAMMEWYWTAPPKWADKYTGGDYGAIQEEQSHSTTRPWQDRIKALQRPGGL